MKRVVLTVLPFALAASFAPAQESGDFTPATTNVWGAEYPRVDKTGRVEVRLKAPEADLAARSEGLRTEAVPVAAQGGSR
jgi:hypothetical protein